MLPRTLPGRIILGFLSLILLTLLVGGIALWRIHEVHGNLMTVVSNSLPSIVTLSRAIQANYDTTRATRRLILTAATSPNAGGATPAVDDSAFLAAKGAGDKAAAEYESLVCDDEDTRLFAVAKKTRGEFLAKAADAIAAVRQGKIDVAKAIMQEGVDPGLETCNAAFEKCVAYNSLVADQQGLEAEANMSRGFTLVIGAGTLATLIGSLLAALIIRGAKRSLGAVSNALEASATQTSMASAQLASASHSLAEGCSEQGSAVEETSAAMEEMSAMIRTTADNAGKAKSLAGQARAAAQTGVSTMREMDEAMRAISASSEEVAKIVKNIDEIAFQTNILALNAAVEAARAGEAGSGFAVVADEVRSLAQRSAAAAKETATRIEAAIADSRRGSSSCGRVGASLEEIVEKVMAADGLVAEIATAAKEQAQGIEQVTASMAQMDQVTQGNATGAEESAGAAEELRAQADAMRQTVTALRSLVGGVTDATTTAISPPPAARPARPGSAAGGIRTVMATARPRLGRIPMPPEAAAAGDDEDQHFRTF